MKRETAGNWDFGLEKEQILETFSAQLQKSWNSTKVIFGINKKYWAEEIPEGARHPREQGVGPWSSSLARIFYYLSKIFRGVSGHSENFYFLHIKQHHGNSIENSASLG